MKGRTTMPTSLQGIAQKAESSRSIGSATSTGCSTRTSSTSAGGIRKNAACGVDQVSAQEDEHHLEANIHRLVERLKKKRYRAKLVRRHYIPKGMGQLRPWGSPP